mmetsp:Transcript_39557/g.79887  ORF Transcript_39557/g.79887 Transcript_39557/m.79887 type:complete len:209 (-) Transcript_39557:149-775(-)
MSLWDDPGDLDGDGLKEKRIHEKEEFFNVPDETQEDWSLHSWAQFRHEAHNGMHDPERQLIPFVDYMPLGLNDDVPVDSKESGFALFNKQRTKEKEKREAEEDARAAAVSAYDSDEDRPMLVSGSAGVVKQSLVQRDPAEVQDAAAVKIQTLSRARLARKLAKKKVCKIWMKKMDTTPGVYYYQNKVTGETRWVPPHLMRRYFPKLRW